ncbi:MAG: hypothetical protein WCI72_00215 [archaeon]
MVKKPNLDEISRECLKYIKADTARISKPLEKMYLIIGFHKNTRDDTGTWIEQNGKRIDFDYVQESVVASGRTREALIESAKEYQRLCGLSMETYLKERIA